MIKTKRIYNPPAVDDGIRILVDRLWPRGLNKKEAKVNLWLKEGNLTLLYGAKDEQFNNAGALREYAETKAKGVKL